MIRYPHETPPAIGEAIEVADGILWLRLPLPMALDHVNVYALREADGWTIIDTGMKTRKCLAAWEALLAGPLEGAPVTRVILTHHHPDHVGLVGWFQERGAELVSTRTAWLFARMLTLDEEATPSDQAVAFWRASGMSAEILDKRLAERPFNFADIVHRMPVGFTRITEGDRIEMGGRHWIVRLGDGHAPDHATFWAEDAPLVIGGDQLLPSISANLGVYPTEPMADPVDEWLQSCHRFVPHAREDQLVLPGHKLPFTGLPDRLDQMIQNHHGALERLRAHLAAPRTAVECFPPLFKREVDEGTYGLALVEAMAHLNHLLALGQVSREMRDDGAWVWQLGDAQASL